MPEIEQYTPRVETSIRGYPQFPGCPFCESKYMGEGLPRVCLCKHPLNRWEYCSTHHMPKLECPYDDPERHHTTVFMKGGRVLRWCDP
jgi:hypothetical protein